MFKYTKYLTNYVFIGVAALGCILGGHWMWLGFVFVILGGLAGDYLLGDHGDAPKYSYAGILTLSMYSYLPVIIAAAVIFIWTMLPGDLFGIGAAVFSMTGYDAIGAKAGNQFVDLLGGALCLGSMFAITNVIMAHELIHRTAATRKRGPSISS